LVVDNHPDTAEIVAIALGIAGHDPRAFTNGPDAIRAAAESWPDVVILDVRMPNMNGYEVAAALLARLDKLRPLLIAHSTADRPDDIRKCREAGFDHCLGKPADLDELLDIIARPRPAPLQPKHATSAD
jgi:CheY-like chemotaxis protein